MLPNLSKLVSRHGVVAVAFTALLLGPARAADNERPSVSFTAVRAGPGAFQLAIEAQPLTVQGKPLDAGNLAALAGKDDGFDIRVDGLSIFGMAYAHQTGRREPLRPVAADLSDLRPRWSKASPRPPCPPDKVQIDVKTGRIRFFTGDDAATFHSNVVARFRGTHGDTAIARWRGNVLFLSHWESAYHVWAYDVSQPAAPVRIDELRVANFAHGFVVLESGWSLMGTTGKGVFLLDLRDPRKMKVVKPLALKSDWLDLVTPRYVAAWRGQRSENEPAGPPDTQVFDVSKLPEELPEVTAGVKPEVRRYLTQRLAAGAENGTAWFRLGDESLALLDLKGDPASWRVLRTVKLPELPAVTEKGGRRRGERIRLQPVVPGKSFVLLYPTAEGRDPKNRLQVLDVSGEKEKFQPALEVEPTAAALSILGGKYAYVSVLPRNRGGGIVGTWEGTHLDIYDLADPAGIKNVGSWGPGFPTRNMRLSPVPEKKNLVLIEEDSTGMGIHFADFADPLRPKLLSSVPLNGEGNRVAAWADKAIYTSSAEAQWLDLSNPFAPKRLSNWFNHRWFCVRHLYDQRALIGMDRQTASVDFSTPAKPRQLLENVPGSAAWGTRVYEVRGGPRSGGGPLRLTIADIADPARLAVLSETTFPLKYLDVPKLAGLWADGPLLYGVTEGKKGQAVFLIWEVADPKKPALLAQLRHEELTVARGDWFWTAQGGVLAAANGIAIITSYGSGPPQVIEARNPREPKFLMRLPYKGKLPHHGNEMTDCHPDGKWFYIKSYPDPVQLWDFSQPEKPRQIWEDKEQGSVYGAYAWQAGVPVGPDLLVPELTQLKIITVPRPSQVPVGKVTWR